MKPKTAAEKRYHDRVAQEPCVVCGAMPVHVHHVREHTGLGVRPNHYDVIALCPKHHQHGGYGVAVHSGVKEWEKNFGAQLELLAEFKQKMGIDNA